MWLWDGTTKVLFYSGLWPIIGTTFPFGLRVKDGRGKGMEPGFNEFTTLSPRFRISKM